MGLENLSVGARSALLEIGRMAYGSREGAKGGKGHIGLLNANGQPRVIKFDTHGGSTGGEGAVQSGNNLRDLLVTISESAGLTKSTLKEIRRALGLLPNDSQNAAPQPGVLERTVAAKVVELIGGKEIWRDVEATFDKTVYKSRGDTSFDSVSRPVDGDDTNNAKTIETIKTFTKEALQNHIKDVLNPALRKMFGDPERASLAAAREQFARDLKDGTKTIDDLNAFTKTKFRGNMWMREGRTAAEKLLECTLKGGGAIFAGAGLPKTVSQDDLNRAYVNLLVTVALASRKNASLTADEFMGCIGKTLESVPGLGFHGLSPERREALKKNVRMLAWCDRIAAKYGVENVKDVKAAALRRLFVQDLRDEHDDFTEVTEEFTFGDRKVEQTGSKRRLEALKAALGQLKTPQEAFKSIKRFVAEAKAHGNQAGYYMKLSEDGAGLTDAGSRNILRGSASRTENNEVRAWLKDDLVAYYGSEARIPARVRQEMTNFEGGGHPLSAERVGKIWRAMEAEWALSLSPAKFLDDPEAAFAEADNMGSLVIPDDWRQTLQEQGYDLSETTVARGREAREEAIRNTRITLHVAKALAEMVESGDLVHSGKQWAKDVSRCSFIRIGDTDFNAREYYSMKLRSYEGNSATQSRATELAESDVELEVTNRLVRFISKGQYHDVTELRNSQDEKMKKLLFFVKAHMDQLSLGEATNDALTGLDIMGKSNQEYAYGVQFGADDELVFSHCDMCDFDTLDYRSAETGRNQSLEVDLEEGRRCQAIKMSYSKEQVDGVLNADFNDYAGKYARLNPNRNLTSEEKAVKDDDRVRKDLVDQFNSQIDPSMVLRPEVKTVYAITAVEDIVV